MVSPKHTLFMPSFKNSASFFIPIGTLLRVWDKLEWRHHGAGMLQAYVPTKRDPEQVEYRVHIWHPALFVKGMEDSGQIHDHRFSLFSSVLHGTLRHDEVTLVDEPEDRKYEIYECVHARKAAAENDFRIMPVKPRRTYGVRYRGFVIPERHRYYFPSRVFHRSWAHSLTITLVAKRYYVPGPARLLAPVNTEPVHAFDPKREIDIKYFVQKAHRELRMKLEAD